MDDLVASDATHCWADPDTLLGAVIAVDQFSRNIHRGSAAAFEGDDVARWLTLHAIGKGWDDGYSPDRRAFLYLPLMHAEDLWSQNRYIEKAEELAVEHKEEDGDVPYDVESGIRFGKEHREIIERFGRFPHRNQCLGRESTEEEREWLKTGQTFGVKQEGEDGKNEL